MYWFPLLVQATLAHELVTLAPSSQDPEVPQPYTTSEQELYVGDKLICNSQECYPKVFEPENYWKEIRPSQHIPGGLDVRMNLDTGLQEAKLGSSPEAIPSAPAATHEFSEKFEQIKDLTSSGNFADAEVILDDLLEFSHDYKHGYKIVSHELPLLKQLALSPDYPISTRKLSSAMLTGSLRNNPPAVAYILDADPRFVTEVFSAIHAILAEPRTAETGILVKRYLSIIQALAPQASWDLNQEVLLEACQWGDEQIKMKALDVVAHLYRDESSIGTQSLSKRSQEPQEIQQWIDHFSGAIQTEDVDELHIRNFFNSLYNIKQQMGKSVKVGSSFLNWLNKEASERELNTQNGVHERDLDQSAFDRKLIESRHLVFGNPMAHRIKRFEDEL